MTDKQPRASRQPGLWREIAIAIVAIAAIALALQYSKRSRTPEEPPTINSIVASLPAEANESREWRERPWPQFTSANQSVSRRGRAVRVGALLVELEVLAANGDSAAAKVAAQVGELFGDYPNGSATVAAYRALADVEAVADSAKRADAARAAETLAGVTEVRLGAWLEAARIAAVRNDTAFFSRPDTWSTLWIARGVAGEDANTRASVTVLSAYIAEPQRDARRLSVALDALLRALAN